MSRRNRRADQRRWTAVRSAFIATVAFAIGAASGGWSDTARALATDRNQPLEIEADYAELDDGVRTAVYTGNVIATQGSMRLTGDVLTVRYTEEKEIKEVLLDGKPAKFRQRPDKGEGYDEGEALRMEYHALDNLLYFIDQAKVNQQQKIFTGHRMVYDTERNIVTIKRATAGAAKPPRGGAGSGSGRVKIVIPPKSTTKKKD